MMQSKAFGASGDRVVIEEYLNGREMSLLRLHRWQKYSSYRTRLRLQAYLRWRKGPNTGGMGSYSPPPFFNSALGEIINRTIMEPTVWPWPMKVGHIRALFTAA